MSLNAWNEINGCTFYPLEIYFQWAIKFVNPILYHEVLAFSVLGFINYLSIG